MLPALALDAHLGGEFFSPHAAGWAPFASKEALPQVKRQTQVRQAQGCQCPLISASPRARYSRA